MKNRLKTKKNFQINFGQQLQGNLEGFMEGLSKWVLFVFISILTYYRKQDSFELPEVNIIFLIIILIISHKFHANSYTLSSFRWTFIEFFMKFLMNLQVFVTLVKSLRGNSVSQYVSEAIITQIFYYIDCTLFNFLLKKTNFYKCGYGFKLKVSRCRSDCRSSCRWEIWQL